MEQLFSRVLGTLTQYSEIHRNLHKGHEAGTINPELSLAMGKLESAMADMINYLLKTKGQIG